MQPTVEPTMSGDEALQVLRVLEERGKISPDDVTSAVGEIRSETNADVGTTARVVQKTELSPDQQRALVATLKARFEAHTERHKNIPWSDVEKALNTRPGLMVSLEKLEATGGEPDVFRVEGNDFLFSDCSVESPAGRRNVVFDKAAEDWLAKNRPQEKCSGNAADMVREWGVDFMDDPQYRFLQTLGKFDAQTWSWLKTPSEVRSRGLALCGLRAGENVYVDERAATIRDVDRGFRCVLIRVPKVKV